MPAPEMTVSEDERWLLSYYRSSEIAGAVFFGRLARTLPSGPIQADVTRHFADEANHARYWTDCLETLGVSPMRVGEAYQDRYLDEAGLPANLIEILSVTYVFERRVVEHYRRHLAAPGLRPVVSSTLRRILRDEGWHLHWVRSALDELAERHGRDVVEAALDHFVAADRAVYASAVDEHDARLQILRPDLRAPQRHPFSDHGSSDHEPDRWEADHAHEHI